MNQQTVLVKSLGLISHSTRGVRSLNPANFRAPWPFVKKGAYGQRKIGPYNIEKFKWPGQNREFPELSPKFQKLNPSQLHRFYSTHSLNMSKKTALVIIADNSEEMEVSITGDCLVRGDIDVTYAGLNGNSPVKCARGLKVCPDAALQDVKDKEFDLVVIPGGSGCHAIAESGLAGEILRAQHKAGRLIAAICAGPIVLMAHGIPADKVTSHFSVKDVLTGQKKPPQPPCENGAQIQAYNYSDDRVVVAGNVITSQGPGTTFEFGLKLVEIMSGEEKAKSMIHPLVLKM